MLENPLETGSLGAGLLLEPWVIARIRPSTRFAVKFFVEGRETSLPEPLANALRILGKRVELPQAEVVVESPRPIALGYAVSGAASLALCLSLAAYTGLALEEAARCAHVAEVTAGTGLGDVVAQYYGRMLEVRVKPGGPGYGQVMSLPAPIVKVLTIELSPMTTREMHRRFLERIHREALKSYTRFMEARSFKAFLAEARRFSLSIGFGDPDLHRILDKMVESGNLLGWYVKKGVAVIVPRDDRVHWVYEELASLGYTVKASKIATEPAVVRPCTYRVHIHATGVL